MDKTKFLGAPKVCNMKGETMSSVTYDILTNWNAAENVIGTVWDTTASNTGKWEGAAGHIWRSYYTERLFGLPVGTMWQSYMLSMPMIMCVEEQVVGFIFYLPFSNNLVITN